MYKKQITYTDFDGNERTETFYFNLSKSEVVTMEMSTPGGMRQKLLDIVESKDGKAIIDTFKEFISMSYGEKSPDGRRFIKSKELSDAFEQTGAYDQLFLELLTDADAGAEFVNGIFPKDVAEQVAKMSEDEKRRLLDIKAVE